MLLTFFYKDPKKKRDIRKSVHLGHSVYSTRSHAFCCLIFMNMTKKSDVISNKYVFNDKKILK